MSSHVPPGASRGVSRGALTTGAIGAFLFALAALLLSLVLSMPRAGGALEGLLILYAGLGLVSAVLLSVGLFASARVYGGTQITAGIFAILAGIGALGTLLVPALIDFNSMRDAIVVAIASSTGTAMLFGIFAGIANHRPARDGKRYGAIIGAGWVYTAAVLLAAIGLKFGLREQHEPFALLSLCAMLTMTGALITHGVGLLHLRNAGTVPAPSASTSSDTDAALPAQAA